MAKVKYDGVVEAVHYTPDGSVDWVRVYERRGPTFSDVILMKRDNFIRHLRSGRKFYAGQRVPLLASTFNVSQPVRLIERDGEEILVTGDRMVDRDDLEGIPII